MIGQAEIVDRRSGISWRMIGWGGVLALLLLPLVAMNFTNEVNWTVGDFIFAAMLMGSVGLAVELTVRASRSYAYRAGAGIALAATFLTVWANAAVGMIGSEDDPYNLVFFGVILLGLAGAVLARFRAKGLAGAMAAAGVAQLGASLFGMFTDPRGGILSALFAGLWLISALLFRKAARE